MKTEWRASQLAYKSMCDDRGGSLPAGWECVNIGGQSLFLDHVTREAFAEEPWEVLRKRAVAAAASPKQP